jgi:surface polysaccharide O-acyltransferase-like enzyme
MLRTHDVSVATLRATDRALSEGVPKTVSRLLFIDNIRTMLTIQVVMFHVMVIYAGTGGWLYKEGREDFVTGALGAYFVTVSQAFFMGLFLFVAAYFVPGAYDRKGAARFLKDRLVRLGIPLLVYSWILSPLLVYLVLRQTQGVSLPWVDYLPGVKYEAFIGSGPLWFVETLLIFSLLYALWRFLTKSRPAASPATTPFPGNAAIALFAALLAVAGFLIRLWRPIFWNFSPLNLQFPFFAQYIALFVVGLIAYRRNWLLNLPARTGKVWLVVGIVTILLFWPMVLAGNMNIEPFLGGWQWQAFAFALWESFVCVGTCIGIIYLFRRRADHQGRLAQTLSRNAYGAYVIHGVVITVIALLVREMDVYPLLKWALVSAVSIPLCFGLSALIRKLPAVDRVL